MQPLVTLSSRRCRSGTLHNPKRYVTVSLTILLLVCGLFFNPNSSLAQCNSFDVDFKQAANRDGGYAVGELHWINSILQQSNSRYIEGMSTLQRLVFTNLTDFSKPTGCQAVNHVLRVKLESRKADAHAYDFITSWDNAYKASEAIAPGFNLIPSRTNPYLHECDAAIGSCSETACNLVTNGGGGTGAGSTFRDLPIIFSNYADPLGQGEKNLTIIGPPVDQNTTRQVIQTYECRYGDNVVIPAGRTYSGTYGRSVRVYVDGGSFTGDNGDGNNAVVFVGYGNANPNDGGDTYIYYDIKWSSPSPNVVIEFAAHIAVGVDGLAAIDPGGCNVTSLGVGYLLNRGASSISGGPYHVIVEDFQDAPGNTPKCEGNLGNLDNQLQGSEVLLIPECDLQGPTAVCANATATYTATVTNPDNATYLWEIINSSQSPPSATINGTATGDVPAPVFPATTTSLSITVNTGGVGTYTVKLTIKNGGQTTNNTDDDITSSCTFTTTVSAGPTITCPQNTTLAACTSQADVNTAFTNWLNSVTSGGGSPTRNPTNPTAPSACGGTTSVTWTVTNDCGTQSCASSFTVTNAPAVVLTCAQNTTVNSCLTQGQVNTAYASWLATAIASGGCGLGPVTNNGGDAPAACGGSKTVTFTVTSSCEAPKTCSASFTVTNAPAVVLTCAQNTTVGSCLTQGAVDAAYTNWLTTATASGGCGRGSVTNNGGSAPAACGGSKTVTFTVTSSCEAPKTCSATFTVTNAPAVVLNCAVSTTVAAGQTQDAVDQEYADWLATATASGGCSLGSVTNNGGSAPAACGGSKTVTFTVTSACEAAKTCSATFTVTAQEQVTLTCPQNTTLAACTTADAINTAFTDWLNSVVSSGGTLSRNPTSPTAPAACGGTTTVTWTVTNSCFSQSCSASFTVTSAPAVVLTCAQNTTVNSCLTQDQVNTAYTNWLATARASGGCGLGTVTNNGGDAPSACGGSKTVTFTVTSSCEAPKTCSASFTVTNAPAVVLTCAQNTTVNSCLTQEQVNTAYASWLATATASGGCGLGPVTNNGGDAPAACGGSKTVTFTVTSSCEAPKTCSASFTVTNAPAVVLNCAVNTTVNSCLTQDQVNTAYGSWLATATASGGCGLGSVTNNGGSAPSACGGSKTVTFTVTSSCEAAKTCSATFTVTNAPEVVLTCAQNTTVNSCLTQGQVNTAYANWLATATASGGCGLGPVTNNGGDAPSACGGSTTVTFTVTSSCEAPKTCSATFTVTNAPAVVLTCAQNTTVNSCLTQDQVNTAYGSWLATATASGGCGLGSVTNNGGDAPLACGGSKTVTFTVTSSCEAPKTCSATFTVTPDNTAPTFTVCPGNTTAACGTTSPTFGTPTATDNCGGTPSIEQVGSDVVTGSCPTLYTRTWKATDACGNTATCSQTISVPCCAANCTYTQGYYGNANGTSCDGTSSSNNPYSTAGLIEHALANLGGSLTIGCLGGKSVTINNTPADIACVIDVLPGMGGSGPLSVAGDFNICSLPGSYLSNQHRINNQLLSQTITLGLNLGINPPTLGNFALQANKWLVTADLVECGSTTVKDCQFSCSDNGDGTYTWAVTYSPYRVSSCKISQALYDALTTKNVQGLFDLANSALCGNALPAGVSYSDITNAVDCINKAFDKCAAFVEWADGSLPAPTAQSFCTLPSSTTQCPAESGRIITSTQVESVGADLNVSAYPNPFQDRVSFVIKSRYSGQGSLEIYNMLGQKIQTVYTGTIVANQAQIVEYRVSRPINSGLIYIFKQGGKQVTGKLLNIQ